MRLIGRNFVARIAELLVSGVGREQVDIGQMRGVSLTQISYQPASVGKLVAFGSSVMK